MLPEIRTKIKALVEDFTKADFQIFLYTTSNIFTLAEQNIGSITTVLVNGNPLESGESYDLDSTTNKITFSGVSFNVNDTIEVNYTFNRYSDTELDEYIRSALVWLSIYDYTDGDFELEDDDVYPTLSNKEEDMVAIIASILIRPDFMTYRIKDSVAVTYPENTTKEKRIQDLISQFKHGSGSVGVILWEDNYHGRGLI